MEDRDGEPGPDLEQAIEADPELEPRHFKARLPKTATPLESLFQGLKLMPEDIASSDAEAWSKVLDDLEPRERLILGGRHGLRGKERLTLQALGAQLGITREWVRQLQERAHWRLRKRAVERGLIHERARNRLGVWSHLPYWPPGTVRGNPRDRRSL